MVKGLKQYPFIHRNQFFYSPFDSNFDTSNVVINIIIFELSVNLQVVMVSQDK